MATTEPTYFDRTGLEERQTFAPHGAEAPAASTDYAPGFSFWVKRTTESEAGGDVAIRTEGGQDLTFHVGAGEFVPYTCQTLYNAGTEEHTTLIVGYWG